MALLDLVTAPSGKTFPPPRAFQDTAHAKLRDGVRNKHRCQLLVAPTGAGKTYLGLRICSEAIQKGRRAIFVCDRTALINQTSDTADEYGLNNHGIIKANHWRRDNSQPLQIASIQTLAARRRWHESHVIVIDEAHTRHRAWVEHIKTTDAAVIGLTATPCTKGLGLSFTNMVNAATMHELTQQKILVPMKIFSCKAPDMSGAATKSSGEWTDEAAAERGMEIIGDVVAEWANLGENRKTIAFGPTIAYCRDLVQRFNLAGVRAELYTSETKDDERRELLEEFRKPDSAIRILVSVEALAKGFDVKDIGCVIDARPLRKSLSTAVQMWGRGLRSSPETDKQDCLLLDHSGNIVRFLKDFTDVYFNGFQSLDQSEKLDREIRQDDEYTPTGCPSCGFKPFYKRCMSCGFEKEVPVMESEIPGEMHEVRLKSGEVIASDKRDLWEQLCSYVRRFHKNPDTAVGRCFHLYRDITGEDKPRHWYYDPNGQNVPITAGTVRKIDNLKKAFNIRSAYSRARRDSGAGLL